MYVTKQIFENMNITEISGEYEFVIAKKDYKLFQSDIDGMYLPIVELTILRLAYYAEEIMYAKIYKGFVPWSLWSDNAKEAVRRVADWGDEEYSLKTYIDNAYYNWNIPDVIIELYKD